MRKLPAAFLFAFAAVLLLNGTAVAHHSMSMYDHDKETTYKATVRNFEYSNPHVQLVFDVRDDRGNVQQWHAEGPSPSRLSGHGWSRETLKPGDEFTIVGNPNRDGSLTMRMVRIILANGQQMDAYYSRY